MKKSQLKDAIRNIGNNWVSYISILLISMLSIATYMGVSSASVNLENGEKLEPISNEEKYKVILEHFELLLSQKGEYTATREIRKHMAWYVKGMENASSYRDKVNHIENADEFRSCLKDFFKQ